MGPINENCCIWDPNWVPFLLKSTYFEGNLLKKAKILSKRLTPEQLESLKLKENFHLILIPEHLLNDQGFSKDEINFDLIIENKKMSLVASLTNHGDRIPRNMRMSK